MAEDSWDAVTYKATIDGQFTDDTFGYVTVSSGYKSGGFQNNPLSPEAVLDSFEPEKATNFELGLKTQMFDDKLRLNSAVFYQPHEDMQLRQMVGTISQTVNAGEAEIKGAEINASLTLFDDFDLGLNYSYIDARFEKYMDNGNDRSGNRVSGTPKNSLSLTARYNMDSPFGLGGYMYLAGNVTYKDKIYLDSSNLPPEILYSTTLVDSTLVYNLDNWEVSLWVKNLTDEDYKTHYAQVYNSYATYGAPRRVGVSASYTF